MKKQNNGPDFSTPISPTNLPSKYSYSVQHSILTQWEFHPAVVDCYFDRYYLLQWSGQYLKSQVVADEIKHDSIYYLPIFVTPQELCFTTSQVSLSFRRFKGKSEGFVLVKVLERNRKEGLRT